MSTATVDGLTLGYEVIGEHGGSGRSWVLTPGGRFSKDTPGIRELAGDIAERGDRVVIWDRPNTGESDVCFRGDSESAMQADAMTKLLEHLDMAPAIIAGGSGGARVSLLAAARRREVAAGVVVWWISGGVFGLLTLGMHYCRDSIAAAWHGGMEAVVELPEWAEVLDRNPSNRQRFLAQDPAEFIATLERWMLVYCPNDDELVPGLSDADARTLDLPALVLRSGASDLNHLRSTSENVAKMLPNARLIDPPWGDAEWNERSRGAAGGGLFSGWPRLAPLLLDWADETT